MAKPILNAFFFWNWNTCEYFHFTKTSKFHGNLILWVSLSLWDRPLSPDLCKTACWVCFFLLLLNSLQWCTWKNMLTRWLRWRFDNWFKRRMCIEDINVLNRSRKIKMEQTWMCCLLVRTYSRGTASYFRDYTIALFPDYPFITIL